MDLVEALAWNPVLEAVLVLGAGAAVVGAYAASARELSGGYWMLGWAALLVAGGLYLAENTGLAWAGGLAFMADALFAPLMLMGALELRDRRPRWAWPVLVGLAVGGLRVGFEAAGWLGAEALLCATLTPAFFAGAAYATWRAPEQVGFRSGIAMLLGFLVFFEVWDAWNDWLSGGNRIAWRLLAGVCVPLAALQFASRLMSLREGMLSAEAAERAAAHDRDLQRWRFDVLFENARDIVAELGPDTRILYVNARVQGVLGLDPDGLTGRRAIDFVPEEDRPAAAETWRAQLKTGGLEQPVVVRVLDDRGRPVWLEVVVSMHDHAGEPRVLAMARDITERHLEQEELESERRALADRVVERNEQLRASLSRLEAQERLAAIGTLASGIAHQINNPVGAISAAAEFALLAEDDAEGHTTQRDSLSRIVDESGRVGRIVKSILRFARHGSTPKWSEDLVSVVRRAVALSRPYVEERGGVVSVEAPSEPLPVVMSPIEIEQVMINLIRNAAEAAGIGSRGVRIRVRVRAVDDRVEVDVEDDGRGIPERDLPRLFDPFFTTRLREGGSGLGLSVAHGIVTDHEGTIEIDSAEGHGTTVRLGFARAPSD